MPQSCGWVSYPAVFWQFHYLLGDHLGSTGLVPDANGAKVAESRYFPYGQTRYTWGTFPTDYRFTGARQEAGLGLYQMGGALV